MAKYPSIGINEEELVEELNSEIKAYERIHECLKVYTDIADDFKDVEKAKGEISDKKAEILGQNFGEFCERCIQLIRNQTKIAYLADLYKKYFPDSEFLKESGLEECTKKHEKFVKSIETRLLSIISTDSSMVVKAQSLGKDKSQKQE